MNKQLPDGVWPTMLTPFDHEGNVDYAVLERLVEWYIGQGVDGLFAVCQSSEMFKLSLEERTAVAAFVVKQASGRVPVIASGHISDGFDAQVEELLAMCATGIDALVLITNRLAGPEEPDVVLQGRLAQLLDRLPPHVPLGFYECPAPYKRLLSPALLRWCADSGRFAFLKDTCCDAAQITAKLEAVAGTGLKVFNANSATLLETLKLGAAGFSGVMANFHPSLYVWLTRNYAERPEQAEKLQDYLSLLSLIERQEYPTNAKYFLTLEGVLDTYVCRVRDTSTFQATQKLEVEQLRRIAGPLIAEYQ